MDQLVFPLPVRAQRPSPHRKEPLGVPRLSIVLVNYWQWDFTLRLLDQIATAKVPRGSMEVIVVDNDPSSESQIERKTSTTDVSVVRWGENRGFAQAVNEAGRRSHGDWLLILNPDMSLRPRFLEHVLEYLDRHEEEPAQPGIIGFGLHNSDGSPQRSTGPFPTLLGTLLRRMLPRWLRKYHLGKVADGSSVDWVSGCCLLIRRACWDDLGGFDPSFFLYYEDVDLCRRARANGWQVIYQPGPVAVHHEPLHSRTVPAHLHLVIRHALLTYAQKHWSPWQFRLLARIVQSEATLRKGWAHCRRDGQSSQIFGELELLVRDLLDDNAERAKQRILQVVSAQEQQCG